MHILYKNMKDQGKTRCYYFFATVKGISSSDRLKGMHSFAKLGSNQK